MTAIWKIISHRRGETDLERERAGLRIGERLRRRRGDRLGGLRALLGGELPKRENCFSMIIEIGKIDIGTDKGFWDRV